MEKLLVEKFLKLGIEDVFIDEEMKNHTTFRVGGPADIIVRPKTEEDLAKILKFSKENNIEYFVKGNGSNLLVRDKGIRGIVIELGKNFSKIDIDGDYITAQAGALLSFVAKTSFKHSLTRLEALSGIPASIGGAVSMNAGAYGTEIKDVAYKVRLMDSEGEIHEFNNEEMNFRYRGSRVFDEDLIVLSATFKLEKGKPEEIEEKFKDFDFRRRDKQPLDDYSAGSTFKRPEGHYASALIDQAGLRGYTLDKVKVSEKHCGFVINSGGATCENVLNLIKKVQEIVYEKDKVKLEMEVKVVGEE